MAIIKIHAIRNTLNKSLDYITNPDKTGVEKIDNSYKDALNYIENPTKTNNKIYVTGINCNPQTALQEMEITKNKWEAIRGKKSNNIAYHIIQSFSPKDNVDFTTAHKIGEELCNNLGGKYQCVVATHVDKEHIHNHVIINAWDMSSGKKYNDCKETYKHLRDVNDNLSKKYGLSIIEHPDQQRKNSYKEWKELERGTSWKEKIRVDIDKTKLIYHNWKEYTDSMKNQGYTITEGAHVTYKAPGMQRAVRDYTLGEQYTKKVIFDYWENFDRLDDTYNKFQAQDKTVIDEDEQKKKIEKLRKDEEEQNYYFNIRKINSKNKKPYKIGRYDRNGRERSSIELVLLLAVVIIQKETGRWGVPSAELFEEGNQNYATPDWKLQNMLNTVKVAREENINTVPELQTRIKRAGTRCTGIKKRLKTMSLSYNKMKTLHDALDKYKSAKPIINQINGIQVDKEKEQAIEKNSDVIATYKQSKQIINQFKVNLEEDTSDFESRFENIAGNIKELEAEYKKSREEYRKLKRLEHNLKLAEKDEFVFGPGYTYEKALIRQEKEEVTDNRKSDKDYGER